MSSPAEGATNPEAPAAPAGKSQLRLLVGVHDGLMSGVNTYIENVAVAAATAVSEVTLLVADDALADRIRARLSESGVRVFSLAMGKPSSVDATRARLSPAYAAALLSAAVDQAVPRLGPAYDVVHLNHPHLAPVLRPAARRVCVAAWFYPHSLGRRMARTWVDSGSRFPRSALLAFKGALHYRNDARGYADADVVVAPTHMLEADLRSRGIAAVQCTPPGRTLPDLVSSSASASRMRPRLLVCCGDLAHPRKNVALALDALRVLGARGTNLDLELVGGNADALRSRLRRLPAAITVTLSGRLPEPEVHARMRAADALLFPSRFEEWGYVAAEAALHGTPAVTLPVYPFAEMLPPPLGIRAERPTPDSYADAIAMLLADPPERSAVATRAEERFGVINTGRALAAVWSQSAAEAMGQRGQSPS